MKKTIMATVAIMLCLIPSITNAATIPKEFIGNWCYLKSDDVAIYYLRENTAYPCKEKAWIINENRIGEYKLIEIKVVGRRDGHPVYKLRLYAKEMIGEEKNSSPYVYVDSNDVMQFIRWK